MGIAGPVSIVFINGNTIININVAVLDNNRFFKSSEIERTNAFHRATKAIFSPVKFCVESQ